jgi:hypothetical protein
MSTVVSILASVAAIATAILAAIKKIWPTTPPGQAADQPISDVHQAVQQAEATPGDTSAIENEISG